MGNPLMIVDDANVPFAARSINFLRERDDFFSVDIIGKIQRRFIVYRRVEVVIFTIYLFISLPIQ